MLKIECEKQSLILFYNLFFSIKKLLIECKYTFFLSTQTKLRRNQIIAKKCKKENACKIQRNSDTETTKVMIKKYESQYLYFDAKHFWAINHRDSGVRIIKDYYEFR